MANGATVAVGETIFDRFVVRSATSTGTLTFVAADDLQFQRPARVWLMSGSELLDRRARVARTLASVRHPCLSPLHVAATVETSMGPSVLAAFRGHVGENLGTAHRREPASADVTVEVIDQVAGAVAAVHDADQSLGNLTANSLVRDTDGGIYLLDPLVAAVGHHGPSGAGPIHRQRDLGALVALVIELLTGQAVPSELRGPRTLPRMAGARPALADLDRLLAEAVRVDRPPPHPVDLAAQVRDAIITLC